MSHGDDGEENKCRINSSIPVSRLSIEPSPAVSLVATSNKKRLKAEPTMTLGLKTEELSDLGSQGFLCLEELASKKVHPQRLL